MSFEPFLPRERSLEGERELHWLTLTKSIQLSLCPDLLPRLFKPIPIDKLRVFCGNMYPYTVTDDRVGRNKKRKDNGKEFFRRDCMRKFSYHETLLCYLSSEEILE